MRNQSAVTYNKFFNWNISAALIFTTAFCLTVYVHQYADDHDTFPEPLIRNSYLPPPPTIKFETTIVKNRLWFHSFLPFLKTCNKPLKSLVEACDYVNIREDVMEVINIENKGAFNLGQVCDIFDYTSNHWQYINDPIGIQKVYPASMTIKKPMGDCEDFAVLVASMIMNIGGEIRINYVCKGEKCHAYTEVNLGTTNLLHIEEYLRVRYQLPEQMGFSMRRDSNGNVWLNLDRNIQFPGDKYFPRERGYRFYIYQNHCEELKSISKIHY